VVITKITTINIAEPTAKALQVLQDLGLYPSRSEAVRVAIRDFLQRELGFAQRFEDMDIVATSHEKIQPIQQVADKKKEIARLLRKLREETPDLSTVA
jgi:Arc/MetJ-type ribon-helix-helix transcriptional regulator